MNSIIDSVVNNPALAWAVVAAVMLIAEVLISGGFFVSFAAAGLLIAGSALIGILPQSLIVQTAIFFALGVGLIPVCRMVLRRYGGKAPDINTY